MTDLYSIYRQPRSGPAELYDAGPLNQVAAENLCREMTAANRARYGGQYTYLAQPVRIAPEIVEAQR